MAAALVALVAGSACRGDRGTGRLPLATDSIDGAAHPRTLTIATDQPAVQAARATELGFIAWTGVAAAPDRASIAVSHNGSLERVAIPGGQRLWETKTTWGSPRLTFSADARQIALASAVPSRVMVLDAVTGAILEDQALEVPSPTQGGGPGGGVTAREQILAITPAPSGGGYWLLGQMATYAFSPGSHKLTIVERGSRPFNRTGAQDGKSIWTAEGDTIAPFVVGGARPVPTGIGRAASPPTRRLPCWPIAWAVDTGLDRVALSCMNEKEGKLVRVVRLSTGEEVASFAGPSGTVSSLALTGDASVVVIGGGPDAIGWLSRGTPPKWESVGVRWRRIEVSASGARAAASGEGGQFQAIDLKTGDRLCDHVRIAPFLVSGVGFASEDELWAVGNVARGNDAERRATELVRVVISGDGCRIVERAPLGRQLDDALWLEKPRAFALAAREPPGVYVVRTAAPSTWARLGTGWSSVKIVGSPDGSRVAVLSYEVDELFRVTGAIESVQILPKRTNDIALCDDRVVRNRWDTKDWNVLGNDGKTEKGFIAGLGGAQTTTCRGATLVHEGARLEVIDLAALRHESRLEVTGRGVLAMRLTPDAKRLVTADGPTGWRVLELPGR